MANFLSHLFPQRRVASEPLSPDLRMVKLWELATDENFSALRYVLANPDVADFVDKGGSASRHFVTSAESAVEQGSIPVDQVVTGSYSLKITVK